MNYWTFFVAALIPMIVGAIWYNPKVFGNSWLGVAGLTEEEARQGNMPVIFGVSYLFALMIASVLAGLVIHQSGITSLFFGDETAEGTLLFDELMAYVGTKHRTFGHGALHGAIAGIFFALPVIGTIALFERKKWKYIWINGGYWILALALMGGFLGQFA